MRRFLSGGSVAERVLAFEKSPTVFGLGSPAPVAVVASGDGRERRIPIMVQPPPPPTPLLFPSAPEVAATKLETSSWMQPSRDIQVGKLTASMLTTSIRKGLYPIDFEPNPNLSGDKCVMLCSSIPSVFFPRWEKAPPSPSRQRKALVTVI